MTNDLGIDRIVVILDPGGEHQGAIHSAVELAAALRLPLHGIFAEDEALLDVAHLSIASHTELGNLRSRALEGGLLAAALTVEAGRSRRLLKTMAEMAGLQTSFATWRGHPNLLAMGARDSDLVVLAGYSRPLTGQAQLPSPWGCRLASDGISVLLLKQKLSPHPVIGGMEGDLETARSLRIAGPLAKQLGGSLVLLKSGVITALSPDEDRGDLARRFTDLKCDMVVIDERETDAATRSILIARGSCSVLLLRHR